MRIVDGSIGAWIRPRLTSWSTITGVIPSGCESYVRVLHPVDHDDQQTIRWRDVSAATGRQVHPLVQWWRLIDAEDSMNPSSELWTGSDPEVGELAQPDNQNLLDLLAHHTTTPDDAYFALWLGNAAFNKGATVRLGVDAHGISHSEEVDVAPIAALLSQSSTLEHPGRSYGVLAGGIDEASAIPGLLGSVFPGPSANLVWPSDRSWCVATEVDFDSTLVGCSASAAADLLESTSLETFRIQPGDSLAYDADLVNGR